MSEFIEEVEFCVFPFNSITNETLEECAALFSKDYGIWGPNGIKPGSRVRLSAKRLKEQYLFNESCGITVAKLNNLLIGYAIFTKFTLSSYGKVVWITQLVVAAQFRSRKVAQNLIHCSMSANWNICGLVSSHPMAVRALEKSTESKCDPLKIGQFAQDLLNNCNIPYMQRVELYCDVKRSLVDTKFYVDHSELVDLIKQEKEWLLGDLLDGFEFFAFVKRKN